MSIETILVQRIANDAHVQTLVSQGVAPLLANLFAARGITDAREVSMTAADLLPVSSLKNAQAMGSLLADCVVDQKRVLIVSDYDCDGATAGSILIEAFRSAGMNHAYLVPDRLKHGYGLTPSIVDEAALLTPKPHFIITVDNGISSNYGVERARAHGMEVLVTDHHLCPEDLPHARLIVNPQQKGDQFASKNVAGCGVAWYVASAMHGEMLRRGLVPGFEPMDLTPLVALGTVADIVVMDANNRVLVGEGLKRIRLGQCSAGILALANVAKKNHALLSCTDIGFGLAPRINAAGRMAHMSAGIECLTTREPEQAMTLALQLDEINVVRRELQKSMAEQAQLEVEKIGQLKTHSKSVIVFSEDWHEGVVGIVAGRIKDDTNRPTFVMCRGQDGAIKGSGRSIEGFHMKHALDEINISHPGILQKFGGHAMAAGATIDPLRLEEFKGVFEAVCQAHITPAMLERKLVHDGALPAKHMNPDDIRQLDLQVWGQGFAPPVFSDEFSILGYRLMGEEKNHLKLTVAKDGLRLDVVAFGEAERAKSLPKALQLVYQPSLNEWNGNVSVQLMARHFSSAPGLDAHIRSDSGAKAKAAAKPIKSTLCEPDVFSNTSTSARFSAMLAQQKKAQGLSTPTAPSSAPVMALTTGAPAMALTTGAPQTLTPTPLAAGLSDNHAAQHAATAQSMPAARLRLKFRR